MVVSAGWSLSECEVLPWCARAADGNETKSPSDVVLAPTHYAIRKLPNMNSIL
jgi:hypothetical protein